MIDLLKNSKIYVFLHINEATGGTELLHQLVYSLRTKLNIEAYLYYPYNNTSSTNECYQEYKNPVTNYLEDKESNYLIYPEAYWIKPYISKFNNIKKVLWWLSVDNYYQSKIVRHRKGLLFYRAINKFSLYIKKERIFDIRNIVHKKITRYKTNTIHESFTNQALLHLVQSYYAKSHLIECGFSQNNIYYLSDFINRDFFKKEIKPSMKEDIVAYNPNKGLPFTKKLIKASENLEFVPLVNMSREEMVETLQRSKIYIDFGTHPGKDRIPREAAILKCCILTNLKGSAAFYKDIPIPQKYKIEDKRENIPYILSMINHCIKNYKLIINDFKPYRNMIRFEKEQFEKDLSFIFRS